MSIMVYMHPIEAILSISIESKRKLFSFGYTLNLIYESNTFSNLSSNFLPSKCKNDTKLKCYPKFKGSNWHLIKFFWPNQVKVVKNAPKWNGSIIECNVISYFTTPEKISQNEQYQYFQGKFKTKMSLSFCC